MKLINLFIEEIMPKKRGTTKFVNTSKIEHWNKYEIADVQ